MPFSITFSRYHCTIDYPSSLRGSLWGWIWYMSRSKCSEYHICSGTRAINNSKTPLVRSTPFYVLLSSVSFCAGMKRDKLEVTVLSSQVTQDFLTRVKLGANSIHIFLINFISKQYQLLSRTELDYFLNVLIR